MDEGRIKSPWAEDKNIGGFGENEPPTETSKMSAFSKIFVFVLVIALAGFGYYYFFMRTAGADVSVEFSDPGRILSGQPFRVTVSFSNNSEQVLKNAVLSVYLPEGVSYLDGSGSQRVIETNVGDVGPGSINPNVYNIIAVSSGQFVKRIEARLSYRLGGSTAEFETRKSFDFSFEEQAIGLSFDVPQGVFSGINFDMVVKYQNNTRQDFQSSAVLKMNYPQSFNFVKASAENLPVQAGSPGNDTWDLGKLPKNATGSITITGNLVGASNSSFDFSGIVSTVFKGQNFSIAEQTANVSISESPLSVSPSVNGSPDYVARAGEEIIYNLRYKNGSSAAMNNVVVRAKLSSEMFDFSTVKTDAFFDARSNTFTWITANTSALSQVLPGGEGTLTLDVRLKENFPIRRISDKNYVLKLDVQIESPTVPPGTSATKTMSVAALETKVMGKIEVAAKAFWRDAASGILNGGYYPPRVGSPTQYTIHWIVYNYSTDVSNAVVSAFLQSGARWTGKVKSNASSQPVYDQTTGKVTWELGTIMATKGVVSTPPEAIFQVELTPAPNQVGQYVTFLGSTGIEADDNFTGTKLSNSYREMTTLLPDDTTISGSVDRAVQK